MKVARASHTPCSSLLPRVNTPLFPLLLSLASISFASARKSSQPPGARQRPRPATGTAAARHGSLHRPARHSPRHYRLQGRCADEFATSHSSWRGKGAMWLPLATVRVRSTRRTRNYTVIELKPSCLQLCERLKQTGSSARARGPAVRRVATAGWAQRLAAWRLQIWEAHQVLLTLPGQLQALSCRSNAGVAGVWVPVARLRRRGAWRADLHARCCGARPAGHGTRASVFFARFDSC